jgi:hypothetical protein
MVGGTPRGSSQLRTYALLKMKPRKKMRRPQIRGQKITSQALNFFANTSLQFVPIAMNINDMFGKFSPNGITIKN